MANKLEDHLLIIQATVDDNNQNSDQADEQFNHTLKKHESNFTKNKKILTQVLFKTQFYLPYKVESPKYQDFHTVVPTKKKAPPLEGENSMENC